MFYCKNINNEKVLPEVNKSAHNLFSVNQLYKDMQRFILSSPKEILKILLGRRQIGLLWQL